MAKQKVFSVYDSKAEAYMSPFFFSTKGQALRAWTDTVDDKNTQFNKHPGDFTLFEIGEFEEQTGTLVPHKAAVNLGTALEHKTKEI